MRIITESTFTFLGVLNEDNKELLDFLVKSEDDLNEFMVNFYDGQALKSMMAYQKHKRKQYAMTKEEFLIRCKEDKKGSWKNLPRTHKKEYINYINNSSISLSEVYDKLKQYPSESADKIITNSVLDFDFEDDLIIEF